MEKETHAKAEEETRKKKSTIQVSDENNV